MSAVNAMNQPKVIISHAASFFPTQYDRKQGRTGLTEIVIAK